MKKINYLILTAALFLISASPVLAVSPNDLRVTVAAIREQIQLRKQARKEVIDQKHHQQLAKFAQRHADRLHRRFGYYHRHLLRLRDKISQRIQIMIDKGQDTLSASQKIDQAAANLDEAKDKGETAIVLFRSVDLDQDQAHRTIALRARDLAKEGRLLFKQSHQLLKEAVSLLKQDD